MTDSMSSRTGTFSEITEIVLRDSVSMAFRTARQPRLLHNVVALSGNACVPVAVSSGGTAHVESLRNHRIVLSPGETACFAQHAVPPKREPGVAGCSFAPYTPSLRG